jgi:uncharacterized membrane protein
MRSRAELLGHSVHQMLIVFPLGLLATAVVFDVISLATGLPTLATAAYWTMAAGILGGLLAAPFGFADWLRIPRGTRARRIGAVHGSGNLVVVALFVVSWFLRADNGAASTISLVLSLAGIALAMVTAWLGGELVARLGVGVYDDANLDAPTSLHAGRHAP